MRPKNQQPALSPPMGKKPQTMQQPASGQTIPSPPETVDPAIREYLEKINNELKTYAHAAARWSTYDATHRALEILIGSPSGNGKATIRLPGCDHVTGPVEWKNQNLAVECFRDVGGKWHFAIADQLAGFRAVGVNLPKFFSNQAEQGPPT